MAQAKELDELRWINRALANGEARIKKQREIVADLDLLGADPTRAKAVLDAINQCINKPTFRRHTLGFLSERRRESYLEAFAAKAMTISLFVQDLPCW